MDGYGICLYGKLHIKKAWLTDGGLLAMLPRIYCYNAILAIYIVADKSSKCTIFFILRKVEDRKWKRKRKIN